jgi:2-aminoadipate transaminase
LTTPSENTKEDLQRIWQKDQLLEMANAVTRPRVGARSLWAAPDDIVPKRELLYLSIGIPDSGSLPRVLLNEAMQEVMNREDDTSLRYGFGPGYFPVRKYLAEKYTHEKGLEVTEDWFQLNNGSAGAIDQIVRSIIDPGDVIVTETPTYMGSLSNFIGVGAEICPVTMDESGMNVQELARKIRSLKDKGKRVKLLYTISSFQNPTSVTMTTERKKELLELAAREKFLILDDDAYGDLYYDAPPSKAMSYLSGGYGVLTVGSFSKILATGLRIGWVHAHPDALAIFRHMRFDMGLNQMALQMMGRFLEQGHLEPHAEKVRALYKKKMTLVADLMDAHLSGYVSFVRPAGGFYLWVRLKNGLTTNQVWRTATQEGVAVNPGHTSIPAGSEVAGEFLRIAYSWTPMDQLEEAVHRLAAACRRVADGDSA